MLTVHMRIRLVSSLTSSMYPRGYIQHWHSLDRDLQVKLRQFYPEALMRLRNYSFLRVPTMLRNLVRPGSLTSKGTRMGISD